MSQFDPFNDGQQEEKAQRIAALIAGYIHHGLSSDEHDELDRWVGESDENQLLFEELTDERKTEHALNWLRDADGPRMLKKLQGSLGFNPPIRRSLFSQWWIYAVAASLTLLVLLTIYFIDRNNTTTANYEALAAADQAKDAAPGRDQAVLTLADGSTIILDEARNGALATQGNSQISKQDGKLEYVSSGTATAAMMNTVATPRGGNYHLTLSDGTKIWLNAASSISFPASFTGDERKVSITGEVYFEVASSTGPRGKKPFKVEVNKTIVEVLGTHFNINAYSDESLTRVTLLEGAVKVNAAGKTSLLKPEQQAQVNDNLEIKTTTVNIMDVMAWKDGLFRFRNADISTVMRQVSRWYDLDIEIANNIPQEGYNCMISRNIPASKVFAALEETFDGRVKFSIEGKKVKVHP